jgi:putative SbcD/Mre11-related phosphoesterase
MRNIFMKFIANEPAMLIGNSLIIADLHIGLECELGMECKAKKLIQDAIQHIKRLLKETGAKQLIILGDVKHRITEKGSLSDTSELEWKVEQETPAVLKEIQNQGIEIIVVKGNHDGRLKMPTEDEICIEENEKKYCLIHGHKSPSQEAMRADFIIMAHAHPAVSFRDRMGKRTVRKVWVKGKPNKALKEKYPEMNLDMQFIIMPAFNEFITGSPINEAGLVGPLLKKQMFKISKAQLFLLNGVEIDFKTLFKK